MAALFLSLMQTVARRSPDNRDAACTLATESTACADVRFTDPFGRQRFAVDPKTPGLSAAVERRPPARAHSNLASKSLTPVPR